MKKIYNLVCVLILLGICLFNFACRSNNNTDDDIEEKDPVVATINFNEDTILLNVGATHKINLEVINATANIEYTIEHNKIISIEDGTITALQAGKTKVTIKVIIDDDVKTTKEYIITVEVKEEMFNITYKSNVDGFAKKAEQVKKGTVKKFTQTPTLYGYDFVGWRLALDSNENISELTITSDITVYAIFKIKEYNITYDLDGGTYSGELNAKHGDIISLGIPSKAGYYFVGWTLEKDSIDYISEVQILESLTLYANYEDVKQYPSGVYPIKYSLNGGKWNAVYALPDEIATDFLADFNALTGRSITPEKFDCDYIESSWFGDMMNNKTYLNKWLWLLDAIWEVAGGDSDMKASDADFSSLNVRGFYIANLCGFFTSTEHKDTYIGPVSADYSDPNISSAVYEKGTPKSAEVGEGTYTQGVGLSKLITPVRSEYEFLGWVDEQGNAVTSISTTQTGIVLLSATWKHETMAEDIIFANLPIEMRVYDSLQLQWTVTPKEAINKKVIFNVIDTDILTIDDNGLIKAKSVGTGIVKIKLASNPDYEKIIEITIWNGDYFDVSYETDSFVEVGKSIQLLAEYVDKYEMRNGVTWSTLTKDIVTVDGSGKVTGVSEGLGIIRATYENNNFDFYVTVIGSDLSDVMKYILKNHNSNASTTYNLGIGSGVPEYYYDVVSGVNNLLFDDLKFDYRYYDKLPSGTKNYGEMTSVEFITVHYTGNMKYGADADNNCSYFNNLEYRASIHYVTGRTNLTDLTNQTSGYNPDAYYAFAGLNEKYGGWHATNGDPVIWDDSGLSVLNGDPEKPVISISNNLKYTINGRETNIRIPEVPSGYVINGDTLIVNGIQYTVFNDYGIITKVENNKYYIARTHWGTQRTPKCICTCGGNRNSIGIESCVDIGSDLEHTWHVTAQLVAKLLVDHNLGLDRVVGHHFFSGKDCPQPFLENDMELWYQFMDIVKAEYELLTIYKDADITARVIKGDGILRNNGLLVQDGDAHCVTYEVSVTLNGVTKKITLATCVESFFKCDCIRTEPSLQNQEYPII